LSVEQAKARPLEELLREITRTQEPVRIEMPEGDAVEIQPAISAGKELKPLERLPGYMPEGWKDALYAPKS
jgi:hypothetical protein